MLYFVLMIFLPLGAGGPLPPPGGRGPVDDLPPPGGPAETDITPAIPSDRDAGGATLTDADLSPDPYDVVVSELEKRIESLKNAPKGLLILPPDHLSRWENMIETQRSTIQALFRRFDVRLDVLITTVRGLAPLLLQLAFKLGMARGDAWAVQDVARPAGTYAGDGQHHETSGGAGAGGQQLLHQNEKLEPEDPRAVRQFAEWVSQGESSWLSQHFSGENEHRRTALPSVLRRWLDSDASGGGDDILPPSVAVHDSWEPRPREGGQHLPDPIPVTTAFFASMIGPILGLRLWGIPGFLALDEAAEDYATSAASHFQVLARGGVSSTSLVGGKGMMIVSTFSSSDATTRHTSSNTPLPKQETRYAEDVDCCALTVAMIASAMALASDKTKVCRVFGIDRVPPEAKEDMLHSLAKALSTAYHGYGIAQARRVKWKRLVLQRELMAAMTVWAQFLSWAAGGAGGDSPRAPRCSTEGDRLLGEERTARSCSIAEGDFLPDGRFYDDLAEIQNQARS